MSRYADLLAADAVAAELGVEIVDDDPLVLAMTVGSAHVNAYGMTHGGIVFTFADIAMAMRSNVEQAAVAIDAHVVFSARSGPGDRLTVRVDPVAQSRRLATYRAVVSNGDEDVASFTGTVYRPG